MIYPISGGAPPPDPPGPPGPDPPSPPPIPAIPSLVFSPAGAVPGSVWVEGSELHYIASNGQEWAGTGVAGGAPGGAIPGSLWVEGENLAYIDQNGIGRTLQLEDLGPHSGQGVGSVWVDPTFAAGQQWNWLGTVRRSRWFNGGV